MKPGGVSADPLIDALERALDALSRRQQLVASNIGNVDTPGHRTQDLDFPGALRRAVHGAQGGIELRRTVPGHQAGGADRGEPARLVKGLPIRADGNNVSIDREMLALAATRGRFETTASIVRFRIRQLLAALEQGGA